MNIFETITILNFFFKYVAKMVGTGAGAAKKKLTGLRNAVITH
jgi:hypothetical protein